MVIVRAAAVRLLLLLAVLAVTGGPAAASESGCPAALALGEAEQRLASRNAELRLAEQAVAGARADLQVAGERPNPTLSLNSTEYDLRRGLGNGDALHKPVDTTLRLEQTFERGGKRGHRMDAARAGLAAAQADYADAARQSRQALRSAWYDLLYARQRLQISRELQALAEQSLAQAGQRARAGDLPAADVARLRVEALRAAGDVAQAQADEAGARSAMALLIGCPADAPPDALGELPSPDAAGVPVAVDDDALARRPDQVAAQARLQAAQAQFALARAAQSRDVTVGVQLEHYPEGVPAPGDGQLLAGVGVSVPLFLWHRYEGEIARAASDTEAAEIARERALAIARGELEAARRALALGTQALRRAREQVAPQAQAALAAVEYAYAHGASPLTDLLDARRAARQSRLDEAAAAHDYALAQAAWQAAVERLPPSD